MKRRSHAAGEALGPRQQCLMRPHHSHNSLIESTKVWCAARCALLPRYFAYYFTAYDRYHDTMRVWRQLALEAEGDVTTSRSSGLAGYLATGLPDSTVMKRTYMLRGKMKIG